LRKNLAFLVPAVLASISSTPCAAVSYSRRASRPGSSRTGLHGRSRTTVQCRYRLLKTHRIDRSSRALARDRSFERCDSLTSLGKQAPDLLRSALRQQLRAQCCSRHQESVFHRGQRQVGPLSCKQLREA